MGRAAGRGKAELTETPGWWRRGKVSEAASGAPRGAGGWTCTRVAAVPLVIGVGGWREMPTNARPRCAHIHSGTGTRGGRDGEQIRPREKSGKSRSSGSTAACPRSAGQAPGEGWTGGTRVTNAHAEARRGRCGEPTTESCWLRGVDRAGHGGFRRWNPHCWCGNVAGGKRVSERQMGNVSGDDGQCVLLSSGRRLVL